jgi:steroid 5-alpha reductase family enzyme
MDRGLWRYSRHPSYFGDAMFWWGVWLFALETRSGWWTLIAPALMTFLLLRVSGVALTERTISKRRPAYARYVERTSSFVPRSPRD